MLYCEGLVYTYIMYVKYFKTSAFRTIIRSEDNSDITCNDISQLYLDRSTMASRIDKKCKWLSRFLMNIQSFGL